MTKSNNKPPKGQKIFNVLSSTRERKQTLPKSIGQKIHFGIELCGKHPFATGLFALISLVGLVLSIEGYIRDREESDISTEQGKAVKEEVRELKRELTKLTIAQDTTNKLLKNLSLTNKTRLGSLQNNDGVIKSINQAVSDLSKGEGILGNKKQIESAMSALAEGKTDIAKQLFSNAVEKGEKEAEQTAKAYRNLGALAFLDDTKQALHAYRRATELNPNNPQSWNQLGHLLQRVGELDQAIAAYNTLLAWGVKHQDKKYMAIAYTNIGIVYKTQGELDKAIEFQQKALAINEALGRKQGMASNYGNLGNVYKTRGELDKAIEFYQKSLAINEALGHKQGMASDYGNLGIVYKTQGELDKAIEFYQKSLAIDEALGHKQGMASDYTNIGIVYKTRGNPAEAKRYWLMSVKLFKEIDSPNVQKVQSMIDRLAEIKK